MLLNNGSKTGQSQAKKLDRFETLKQTGSKTNRKRNQQVQRILRCGMFERTQLWAYFLHIKKYLCPSCATGKHHYYEVGHNAPISDSVVKLAFDFFLSFKFINEAIYLKTKLILMAMSFRENLSDHWDSQEVSDRNE